MTRVTSLVLNYNVGHFSNQFIFFITGFQKAKFFNLVSQPDMVFSQSHLNTNPALQSRNSAPNLLQNPLAPSSAFITSADHPNLSFQQIPASLLHNHSPMYNYTLPNKIRRKRQKTKEKTTKLPPTSPSEKPYPCPYEGLL